MKTRKGVAAVVFTNIRGNKKYLILKRKLHWKGYEFLKGGLKKGENEDNAIRREIREETGKLSPEYKLKKTNLSYSFAYERPFIQDKELWAGSKNRVYTAEFDNPYIRLDKDEHSGFKWMSKKDALRLLTWPNQKDILRKF